MDMEQWAFAQKTVQLKYLPAEEVQEAWEISQKQSIPLASFFLREKILSQKEINHIENAMQLDQQAEQEKTNYLVGEKDTAEFSERATAQEIQREWNRYKIEKKLGEGGMGVVYKAYDTRLERYVALKVLQNQSEMLMDRFLVEAKAISRLKHPNIVNLYDIHKENGIYFFTMDYIDGASLEEILRRQKIPRQEYLEIMVKICHAMDYAHKSGVIHRDIKPGNIMISNRGEPYIMDFGLAKIVEEKGKKLSQTGMPLGTPAYMPPEQASGKNGTALSDVYSLGALLYRLLTGKEPFYGDTVMKILKQVLEKDPLKPSYIKPVPRDLEIICCKAMEKDPMRRYSDAQKMADDIQRFLHREPILARPASFGYLLYRKISKNWMLSGSIAICIFMVVFFFFLFQYQSYQEKNKRAKEIQSVFWENVQKARESISSSQRGGHDFLTQEEILKNYESVRLYSASIEMGMRSEFQDSLLPVLSAARKERESILLKLQKDAEHFHKKQFCQKAIEKYQALKNILYTLDETPHSLSQKHIDSLLSSLYTQLWKAQRLQDQAKTIFYNSNSSVQDIQKAIQILTDSSESNQESHDTFYLRARLYERLSQKENAIQDFQACLALRKDAFAAKYYLIKMQAKEYMASTEKQRELEEYLKEFFSAIQEIKYQQEEKAYYFMIEAYQAMFNHNRDIAQKSIKKAQEESPLLAESFYTEANFMTYFLQYEEEIRLDAEHTQNNIQAYYNFGKAKKSLQRAIDLDPTNLLSYTLRGKMAMEIFAFQDAIKDFSFVLSHQPNAYCYWLRAVTYLSLGELESALADFQKIKKDYKVCNLWIDFMIFSLLEKLQRESQEFLREWKKENFSREFQELKEVLSLESLNKKEYEILQPYKTKEFRIFFKIPFIIMAMKSGISTEEILEIYKNTEKAKSNMLWDAVPHIFKNQKKLAEFFLAQDIFSFPLSADKLWVLRFLQERIHVIGDVPFDSLYAQLFRFIVGYMMEDTVILDKFNRIYKKIMGYRTSMEVFCSVIYRCTLFRQQNLLRSLPSMEYAESYYYRGMLAFQEQRWEDAMEDIHIALALCSTENKYHYAMAKVMACSLPTHKEKSSKSYLSRILYHLEQAISKGLNPLNTPLQDDVFSALYEDVSKLVKKYEQSIDQENWEKLWVFRKQKNYKEYDAIYKNFWNQECLVFLGEEISAQREQEYEKWMSAIKNLPQDQRKEKWEEQISEALPRQKEKIEQELKTLCLSSQKILRVSAQGDGDIKGLQDAIDIAGYGTTIQVLPGNYQGPFVLKSGISLVGAGEKTILSALGEHIITATDVRECRVENFHIVGHIHLRHSHILWKNNQLENNASLSFYCFGIHGSSDISIEKCTIKGALLCSQYSTLKMIANDLLDSPSKDDARIILSGHAKAFLEQNTIKANQSKGILLLEQSTARCHKNQIHFATYAIFLQDHALLEMEENILTQNHTGIFCSKESRAKIYKNNISSNSQYGIYFIKPGNIEEKENLFYENAKGNFFSEQTKQ